MREAEPATSNRNLLVVRDEFLEKGYRDAWLRDISQKADATAGTLYYWAL